VAKLQALVRIPTVSDRDAANVDTAAFDAFLAEHERLFPRLYAALELTRVGTTASSSAGPARRRPARRPDGAPRRGPVDETAPWQHPPFSAEIHDGAVWGRGTLDDKGCVVAISEAVERLLEQGSPRPRTCGSASAPTRR
jgi:carboxypeptidase PM20D1